MSLTLYLCWSSSLFVSVILLRVACTCKTCQGCLYQWYSFGVFVPVTHPRLLVTVAVCTLHGCLICDTFMDCLYQWYSIPWGCLTTYSMYTNKSCLYLWHTPGLFLLVVLHKLVCTQVILPRVVCTSDRVLPGVVSGRDTPWGCLWQWHSQKLSVLLIFSRVAELSVPVIPPSVFFASGTLARVVYII